MQNHVLIFSASWCSPCRQMKHFVWSNSDVQDALEKFDSVQTIDIDQNKQMAMAYRVDSVPRVYIVDEEGKPTKMSGFMGIEDTVEFLNDQK